ncbi:MAG: isocitrate lyase/phosphoenolpyruvate mutase family protein, partial [Myxococcota bacterium]
LVEALPLPVNAMVTPTGLGVAELAGLGVRRISYGSFLFRAGQGALPERLAQIAAEAGYSR